MSEANANPAPTSTTRRWRAAAARWLPCVLLAGTGAGMAWWSWGTWPDVLIDFGRELYVPWQLAEGRVLYRDVAHFNGPLSQYVNALFFRVFGVGLRTLVVANLGVLALLVVLLYRVVAAVSGRFAALVGCEVVLLLFAFGQLVPCGNYNFVCPYAHEVSHGMVLSVAAVGCLAAYWRGRSSLWVGGSGLSVGLAFLTKAEVSGPAALAAVTGLVLTLVAERPSRRRLAGLLGAFVGAALVPPLAAFGLLCTAMPAGDALAGTSGTWAYLLRAARSEELAFRRFYGWQTGLLDPAANLRAMLSWTGRYALVFVPAAALALAARRIRTGRVGVLVAALCAVGLLAGLPAAAWLQAFRPLPLLMVALGVSAVARFVRGRGGTGGGPAALRVALVVLAGALLGKMPLHARLYHYGFALAMPATVLVAAALVGDLPAWLARRGGAAWFFRLVGLVCIGLAAAAHLRVNGLLFRRKVHRVARGADAFVADARGAAVAQALDAIAERVAPGHTLAAFPEGVMLNYLARRRNPTPYLNFMPTELSRYGEARVLAAYQARPPDWVALVHKDTSEFGLPFFGQHYGRGLYAWLRQQYVRRECIGAEPLRDGRFGILLLERRGPR